MKLTALVTLVILAVFGACRLLGPTLEAYCNRNGWQSTAPVAGGVIFVVVAGVLALGAVVVW